MENNERDRKLDQWLDEALSQYSAAEPRLGLEQRLLASVRAEERAQAGRRSWWRWMPAFAAIAAMLIVMVAVKPYWEQKAAPKQQANENIATYSAPVSRDQVVAGKLEEPKSPAAKKSVDAVEKVARAKQETAAPEKRRMLTKDANLDERREAEVSPKVAAVPASRAYRYANEVSADKKLNAKESGQSVERDELKQQQVQDRSFQSLVVTGASPAAPALPTADMGRTAAGMNTPVGGTVTTQTQRADAAKSAPAQTETIEVQVETQNLYAIQSVPPKAKPDAVVSGIVGAGMIGLADAAANAKTVVAKSNGALTKKAKEPVRTEDAMGMGLLKTELKQVPPGPTQQFPTPAPLSEEEKMMLAARRQLKGKPVNEEKSDDVTSAIEIKKIEIAPLPGPPK